MVSRIANRTTDEMKTNKWYMAADEPRDVGFFRKGAFIGGNEDLQGLLEDKSLAPGSLLVNSGNYYIVVDNKGEKYTTEALHTIAAIIDTSRKTIAVRVGEKHVYFSVNDKDLLVVPIRELYKIFILLQLKGKHEFLEQLTQCDFV